MKDNQDRFDSLICFYADEIGVPFALAKSQAVQESGMNPKARSAVGAVGLFQLMPRTDQEVDGKLNAEFIEENIHDGLTYLREQFDHLSEIPNICERWKFALAAYNGGRGYVNAALKLARASEDLPGDFHKWLQAGSPKGQWQYWDHTFKFLAAVKLHGKKPDYEQMIGYVDHIVKNMFTPNVI